MSKFNLPDNWVAATSSKYANRVYYFNVVTNKSSWVHPNSNNNLNSTDEVSHILILLLL